jgi:hypothetical protein
MEAPATSAGAAVTQRRSGAAQSATSRKGAGSARQPVAGEQRQPAPGLARLVMLQGADGGVEELHRGGEGSGSAPAAWWVMVWAISGRRGGEMPLQQVAARRKRSRCSSYVRCVAERCAADRRRGNVDGVGQATTLLNDQQHRARRRRSPASRGICACVGALRRVARHVFGSMAASEGIPRLQSSSSGSRASGLLALLGLLVRRLMVVSQEL